MRCPPSEIVYLKNVLSRYCRYSRPGGGEGEVAHVNDSEPNVPSTHPWPAETTVGASGSGTARWAVWLGVGLVVSLLVWIPTTAIASLVSCGLWCSGSGFGPSFDPLGTLIALTFAGACGASWVWWLVRVTWWKRAFIFVLAAAPTAVLTGMFLGIDAGGCPKEWSSRERGIKCNGIFSGDPGKVVLP